MSLLNLPNPDGWQGGKGAATAFSIGILLIIALPIVWGVIAFGRGYYLTTVVMFGLVAVMLTPVMAMRLTTSKRIEIRAKCDSNATTLRPDKGVTRLLIAALSILVPVGALFVIFMPRGDLYLPISRGLQIFSPILMAAAVAFAIAGLILVWRRRGMGYVELSDAGIENATIATTKFIDWVDIVAVKDSADSKRTRRAVVLQLRDGSEETIEGADTYVPGGAGLYWMIRQYWRNGDERAELTDGRALQRLQEGRFDLG